MNNVCKKLIENGSPPNDALNAYRRFSTSKSIIDWTIQDLSKSWNAPESNWIFKTMHMPPEGICRETVKRSVVALHHYSCYSVHAIAFRCILREIYSRYWYFFFFAMFYVPINLCAATAENVIVLVRIEMSRAEANFIKCVCLRTRHIIPDQLCDC